ncbi:rRNA pseudouridine synthase [Ferriphaselus sp. R-1]|uniref:rRNA pseudouridine synthase n=1 Tax=Ferriphaselus sp. R-1 TaxID=1485544 RepID=UPI0005546FAD|nr:rRNA pseudouridine synthase [Ferriphaselus sp. R-1]
MTDSVRLAKRLAALHACSRRAAELYITGGWVSVDGHVVEEPQFMVEAAQQVELHPDATLTPLPPATLLLHHPADADAAIRAETRMADDPSGIRTLKQHFVKLTQYLPLQAGASGLTVYTQDWKVARKLGDDAATLEQEYVVEVTGELVEDGMKRLNQGEATHGKPPTTIKVSWQNETRLRFALKNPQPGQIARLCLSVGLQVVSMKRLRIGRLAMGKIPPGQWRYLAGYERF